MSMMGLINEQLRGIKRPSAVAQTMQELENADAPVKAAFVRGLQAEDDAEQAAKNVSDQLAKYIPGEALALYLGAVSAASALEGKSESPAGPGIVSPYALPIYWLFVVFTPVLFLLLYMGKRRSGGDTLLPTWAKFPWWQLVASSVAFAFWALAVPMAPYLTSGGERAIAAFLALFVATMLPILEPIFVPPPTND